MKYSIFEVARIFHFPARPPHLLLLPSDLSHFVREVQGSTVVNPGRVTRGQGPGTWARAALTARGGGVAAAVEVVRI